MRLTDCFMELIAYVAYFLKTASAKQPSHTLVKAEIDRLISNSQQICEKCNFSPEDYILARFAVFAWIDEAILSSGWNEKNKLAGGTTSAGVLSDNGRRGAFLRPPELTWGRSSADVREVYYLCLAMGFTGRHRHAGDEILLDQMKSASLNLLSGSPAGLPLPERSELFPEAYASPSGAVSPIKTGFPLFAFLWFSFPVILYLFLFVIYKFVLSNIGNNLLATVL